MDVKRMIALILAAILLFGLLAGILPNVSAAGAYTVGLQTAANDNAVTVEAGEEVALYLYLANNPGVISVGITLNCPAGFSVVKTEKVPNAGNYVWQFSPSTATNPYLVWMLSPKELVTDNGNIRKITLSVADTAVPGEYTIKLSAPADKNLTAEASGSVIKPNTNKKVTGIATANFTVTVIPSTCKHQWGNWETEKKATCDEAGEEVRSCTLCQNTQTRTIDATGHQFGAWTSVKNATCTQKGEQKRTCRNDGCTYAEKQDVAAFGHSFTSPEITKQPTCTKPGEKTGKCSRCNQKTSEEIPATGHSFGEWVVTKSATCDAEGQKISTCANCREKSIEVIAKTEHKFEKPQTTKAATCTQPGEETGKCVSCEKTTKNVLPALGHNFGQPEVIREATATVPGLKRSKCTRCNVVEETEIPCTTDATQGTEATTEETTDATAEVTTEAATEATTEQTVTTTQPTQIQQDDNKDNKQILFLVIGVAGALLLGILITVIVMASTGRKKKEDIENWL